MFTRQELPEHPPAHKVVGVQVLAFFLAASDGAAVSAIAVTATAPTSRIFAMDFMVRTPLVLCRPLRITRWNFAHKVVVALLHR